MDVLELNPVIRISCMGDPCPSPIEMWMVLKNFNKKLVHKFQHYLKRASRTLGWNTLALMYAF